MITFISCMSVLFNSVGSVKIEIKPVNPFDGSEREDATTEKREAESLKDSSRWRETKREREGKALSDPQIVRDFLMGDHCLYGGTGWWKYEFCYGMFWCSLLTLYPQLDILKTQIKFKTLTLVTDTSLLLRKDRQTVS